MANPPINTSLSPSINTQHAILKNRKNKQLALFIGILITTIATIVTIAVGASLSSWPILSVGITLSVIIFILSGLLLFLRKKTLYLPKKTLTPSPLNPKDLLKKSLERSLSSLITPPPIEDVAEISNPYEKKLIKQLLASWYLQSNPKNASVSLFCPNNKIQWTIARHNTILPFLTDISLASVVVNSTNQYIEKTSGAGVNSALSKVVPALYWNQSKEGKNELNLSEAVGGAFAEEHPRNFPSGKPMQKHAFLVHAYTPNVCEGSSDIETDLQVVKTAYVNTFQKASKLLNGTPGTVQLPLFSSGKSAPKEEPLRSLWLSGANSVLEEAIQELPLGSCIKHVVLLEYVQRPPLAGLALQTLKKQQSYPSN